jgi:hypothetical protein
LEAIGGFSSFGLGCSCGCAEGIKLPGVWICTGDELLGLQLQVTRSRKGGKFILFDRYRLNVNKLIILKFIKMCAMLPIFIYQPRKNKKSTIFLKIVLSASTFQQQTDQEAQLLAQYEYSS